MRDIEARERRRFKPFIWVHTEDGAHSFFSAMVESHLKVLWMGDGFESLSEPEQLSAVQERIRDHYAKVQRYPGFGAILRYQWARTFDASIVLDTKGTVIDGNGDQFLLPGVWLALHPREFWYSRALSA